MRYNKKNKGSNLVEYVVPMAIIGIAVGTGIFYSLKEGSLFNNILFSSAGKTDISKEKLALGKGVASSGIYVDDNGILRLNNDAGQSIILPVDFYEKYKDQIQQYMNDGRFNPGALAVETSGAAGIENIAHATAASTMFYSTLIEIASKNQDDDTTRQLLENMTLYGKALGNIENNLIDIDMKIKDSREIFEAQASNYLTAKKSFEAATSELSSYMETMPTITVEQAVTDPATGLPVTQIDPDTGEEVPVMETTTTIDTSDPKYQELKTTVNRAYKGLSNTYNSYSNSLDGFMNTSSEYLGTAETLFNDLKGSTGSSYDQTLEDIKTSDKVLDSVKDMVVPIGEKIKSVKDSVDLYRIQVAYSVAAFNDESRSLEETLREFQSLDIKIDSTAGDQTLMAVAKVNPLDMPEISQGKGP